jgi:type IV secretory pathway VirB2 component (pilin)
MADSLKSIRKTCLRYGAMVRSRQSGTLKGSKPMRSPTASLTDPPIGNPIAEGVNWVQGATLGSVATIVAVIAVAAVGLLLLSGRLDLRRGTTVVLGCFILFGAAGIAAVLTGVGRADTHGSAIADRDPLAQHSRTSPSPPASAYDPYAGASVPTAK